MLKRKLTLNQFLRGKGTEATREHLPWRIGPLQIGQIAMTDGHLAWAVAANPLGARPLSACAREGTDNLIKAGLVGAVYPREIPTGKQV